MAKQKLTFKEAVQATPDVQNGYQKGLLALGQYAAKISAKDTSLLDGSVDIDTCTTKKYPLGNRWDYALSYNQKVYFVEVHSANTSEVSTMLKKLQWLKDWLNQKAPEINLLPKMQPAYYWIQSGNFNILKESSQYRQIVQAKLKPRPSLTLQ